MTQHLSDEAVAAYADGMLRGVAQNRAVNHVNGCPECAHAVAVQREAVWALRAAPAPSLPSGLFDRLTALPQTAPIDDIVPSSISPDGSAMIATFGSVPAAALVPAAAHPHASTTLRKAGPIALTAAALAAAGAFAIGSANHTSTTPVQHTRVVPAHGAPRDAFVGPNELSRLVAR